ncbi:AAA family ATPase [Achromobacter sp. AGC39]
MSFGLCGTHGTGKTTLARLYSERTGLPFVESRVSQVFKDMGLDSGAGHHPLSVRVSAQERLLAHHNALYQAAPGGAFITDRTPLDFMAYMLSDVRAEELTPELDERIKRYLDSCYVSLNRHFSCVVLLQAVPEVVPEAREGRGALSHTFRAQIEQLCRGLSMDTRVLCKSYSIPIERVALESRVEALMAVAQIVRRQHQELAAAGDYRTRGLPLQ